MGTCFCCLSTEQQVEYVMNKFEICALSQLASAGPFPRLVTGRIIPASHIMKGPLTGISCVYYSCAVYQWEKNGDSSSWNWKFTEAKWVDFFLGDPSNPMQRLYVPAGNVKMSGEQL